MLQAHWTVDQLLERKTALAGLQLTPEYRAMMKQQERTTIQGIRQKLGRHVVVVFRKGGRIAEERRYDSEADSLEEVMGVELAIGLAMPIGIDMIGKGWVGLLPWQMNLMERNTITEEERFNLQCPVRIADVADNTQTGITTIYLESV